MDVHQINMVRYLKFRLNWASWTVPVRSGEGRAPDMGEPFSPLEIGVSTSCPPGHHEATRTGPAVLTGGLCVGFYFCLWTGKPLIGAQGAPPPGQGLPGTSLDKLPQIAHHCLVHRWGDTTSGSDQVMCSVPRGWGCWGTGQARQAGEAETRSDS